MIRLLISLSISASTCLSASVDPVKLATVKDDDIDECSGIAASYLNPNCLWMHNDSGDKANLFLVSLETGRTRAILRVKGADNYDWEDMCSFVLDGKPWLLVGDVGDNSRRRGKGKADPCRLYLIHEPEIEEDDKQQKLERPIRARIEFKYEDGRFDCEGIAVDTERKEILLVTKELNAQCGLYSIPLEMGTYRQSHTARRIASPFIPLATAMDIAPNNREMFIGTMINGYRVSRKQGESWADAFKRPATPIKLPPRRQGESACFDRRRNWVYVNSEFKEQPLWRVEFPLPENLKENEK